MAFVGFMTDEVDGNYNGENLQSRIPTDIAKFRNKLEEKISPLGVWKPREFGLWVVTCVGC
jgi:hypothetical protein